MTHILYIEASPRKDRSASIEIAQAALSAWQATDRSLTIDTLDLWSAKLPEFDGAVMEAKYAGIAGNPLTDAQAAAWSQIRAIAARFLAADVLVLAVPLWNFSIPYKLKHLIDVVSQKDVLFTFDELGFGGLLRGRKALLICARGLDYGPSAGTPAGTYDFQKPYIETWLRFIGISEIRTVVAEKTLFGPNIDRAARDSARTQAIAEVKHMSRAAGGSAHLGHGEDVARSMIKTKGDTSMTDQRPKIAALVADAFQEEEYFFPKVALNEAGYQVEVVSSHKEPVEIYSYFARTGLLDVDRVIAEARSEDYVGVLVPGGAKSPALLAEDSRVTKFVQDVSARGGVIACICRGSMLAARSKVVAGRRMTGFNDNVSYPELVIQPDVEAAGATWVQDAAVVVDGNLVTSPHPRHSAAFSAAIVEMLRK